MPGAGNSLDLISLSVFLQEADVHEVEKFQQFLSPGDGRRVQFWRESVVAVDQPTRLTTLLRDHCQDGPGQLKDVRPGDEEAFKFENSPSEALRYSSELRSRMAADLESEFSKPWPGKFDVLKIMRIRKQPKKSCSTQ